MSISLKPKFPGRLGSRPVRAVLIAMLIALPAGTGAAVAVADSGNSSAVAVNTKNGSSVFKLTFAINQVSGTSVTNQNAAIAYSSCTACQTVAISIQILLISGSPTTFAPTNVAIAINQNCTLCDTLAAAYQFAVGIGTQVKVTAAGRQQIAAIRQQLQQLRNSSQTGPQINVQLNTLMTQLGQVLQTQLIGINTPAGGSTGAPPGPTGVLSTNPTSTTPTGPTTTPTNTATTTAPTTTSTSTSPTSTSPTATNTTPTNTTPTASSSTPTTATTTSPTSTGP